LSKSADFSYSLGFTIGEDGKLDDVIVGSPAYQAGIGPRMQLVAVNGRKWSPAALRAALKTAQGTDQPIELLVENAQFFKTYAVNYHGGERNPHLERVSEQPDILGDILKPLTH
jgi:predicted metalloprotease with PDZ domain